MKAVILAAGRGSRMNALTADQPKCLVRLGGRPLLEWQLAALRGAGITDIAVVRGYRRELLDGRGLTCFDNGRWAETNMVRSLECAADWLRSGPCLVSYSDIFYGKRCVSALAACPAELAITYDPHWLALWSRRAADPLADAETFRLDGDRLIEIGRRPRSADEVEGQYMGLLHFTPAAWGWVEEELAALSPAQGDRLDMTSLLGRLIAAGRPVRAVANRDPWGEVDTASDRDLYEAMMAAGELRFDEDDGA